MLSLYICQANKPLCRLAVLKVIVTNMSSIYTVILLYMDLHAIQNKQYAICLPKELIAVDGRMCYVVNYQSA